MLVCDGEPRLQTGQLEHVVIVQLITTSNLQMVAQLLMTLHHIIPQEGDASIFGLQVQTVGGVDSCHLGIQTRHCAGYQQSKLTAYLMRSSSSKGITQHAFIIQTPFMQRLASCSCTYSYELLHCECWPTLPLPCVHENHCSSSRSSATAHSCNHKHVAT